MMPSQNWQDIERRLDELFTPGCDPYQAGAVALLGPEALTDGDRERMKYVFMRIAALRAEVAPSQQALRAAAGAFHRIVAAISADTIIAREGHKLPTKLYDAIGAKKLSTDELSKVAADGFELCIRALAAMGAADVTIHECGTADMEQW